MNRVKIPEGHGVQVGDHNAQDNKFIQTYIERLVVQAPSAQAAGPVVAGEVPQPPPAFQPRPELLAALRKHGPGVAVVRAVTGMRGVGKTQAVAAYARACIDEAWRLVAWVNAGDQAKVLNGLAVVAARLGIGGPDASVEELSALVRNRLEADGERCLVVFDNVADLDGVRPFLPAAGKAQVVITSTGRSAAGLGTPVPVDLFSEEEALAFLARRTGRTDPEGAANLARELGYLPLALAQAAAVVAAQQLDYARYLTRLRSLPVQEYLNPIAGEPYPDGVAQAVLLSLDSAVAADRTGLCARLIDMVSLLSTAGVPRALLYAARSAGVFSEEGQTRPTAQTQVEQDVDEALGKLADASLLTFSGDGSAVSAHRLIMRVVRERRAHDGTLTVIASATCDLLSAVTQSLELPWQNRPAARDTIQQIMALHEHLAPYIAGQDATLTETLLHLRSWATWCLTELGDSFTQAIEYGEDLVSDSRRVLGETHPDTLVSRNELALAYQAAGRLDQAILLSERNLADAEQVLGETEPGTLISRNNLAAAYEAAGRLDEATLLYERNLADTEQVLGETHSSTLTSRDNLAGAYKATGRLDQAISLYERTLADFERVLGESHPDTLISRNELALAYQAAGRLDEAIPLYERNLADRGRVLGETHPGTLLSLNNLAAAYEAAGRLDEAIPLYERNLADAEQVLGETHPSTLTKRDNLAGAYKDTGRLDQAISLYERTLADFERVLGESHPDTLISRDNLAAAYMAAGRLHEARELLNQSDPGPEAGHASI